MVGLTQHATEILLMPYMQGSDGFEDMPAEAETEYPDGTLGQEQIDSLAILRCCPCLNGGCVSTLVQHQDTHSW